MTPIPADHITFLDDGTAWWVLMPIDKLQLAADEADADRPCDTCNGTRNVKGMNHLPGDPLYTYPDCIDGRHTFDIEVETGWDQLMHYPIKAIHRVSIVPGMVLPIVNDYDEHGPFPLVVRDEDLCFYLVSAGDEASGSDGTTITLPPAAAPGMWAVKLKTQPTINQGETS